MLVGVLISALFMVVNLADFASLTVLAGILGVYFGVGMPICLGYFAASTEPQNRAKFSGVIILLIGLGFTILSSVGISDTFLTASGLALWLFLGLICLIALKPADKKAQQNDRVSYRSIVSNKTFLLYLVPWFLFSLINDLTMQINTSYFSSSSFPSFFANNYLIVENILAGASAIIIGFLADKKGRKRFALIGFALLGMGYASLGLFNGDHFVAWFYVCADGIAWGAFSMLFLVTLWGDIAQGKSGEKYYFIGILPYLLSTFTRVSLGAYISQNISENTVFSFASFFLFVSILPLVYAPETLPDKIILKLDLNNYVNKALEKVKKESTKKQKSQTEINPKKCEIAKEESQKPSLYELDARKFEEKCLLN